MKWLVVLVALFMHTQVFAAGVCHDGKCIGGWDGATIAVSFSGALHALIDKFTTTIVYDSYVNHNLYFGFRCVVNPGYAGDEVNQPEPPSGCMSDATKNPPPSINVPLATAFKKTLKAADNLLAELDPIIVLSYNQTSLNAKQYDKIEACRSVTTYLGVASFWNKFNKSFQKDFEAYRGKYRKKIFRHHFQTIKRIYGLYANRMKKLTRKIKSDYNCDV